ncbi:CPBP family intramembrane metalloprotease [Pseudoalteromonas xiamenensis]|uniref:CPBP family intramembrane glutamic endopeptidase n=1 Tax=Pseudoalteromonas xiamenensis TaxID=882626 RepID=UPI0027E4902D|nr:CPBP family intramembrane glutamic endopeptidase [Pseudoalteromonas xiamenensis]WMN60865.1 CPBP family intramembrane metalloprotease [Pseudoalteromonas xiamenensis]
MEMLRRVTREWPILSFLVLCFFITWSIWFSAPSIAGTDWAFVKIIVGAGFGPAIAAIVLAQLNGTGCSVKTLKWWGTFSLTFVLMCCIYSSVLSTGDAITLAQFEHATPVGFTVKSVISVVISSAVTGFIVACLNCSKDARLKSLFTQPKQKRWLFIAFFLPAGWMSLGILTAYLTDSPIQSFAINWSDSSHLIFLTRSILFTFFVVAIGEEAGWRAWLLPELQKRFSPLASSFYLGLVWGAWHFPLFVIGQYAESPIATIAKMGACVLLATMFTYLFNRSNQSLLVAVLFHTALNNSARVLPLTEQSGIFMLMVFVAMIFLGKMWKRQLN